jgi:ubiquinone/menaquinone biosynthesis C-methylase UbiE
MNRSSHPFDAAAPAYDETFTERLPGRWFRDTVWSSVKPAFQKGDHVLDLGCGTGEDAVWLAGQGVRVTAVDVSERMLRAALDKAEKAGVSESIRFLQKDLSALSEDTTGLSPSYDGVLSNFGALNCVEDLKALAETLSGRIRPGGQAFLVLMGPVCPWEIAWFLSRGRFKKAFRRFSSDTAAHVGKGETIRVRYPSVRRVRLDFSPFFRSVRSLGIGVLVPPPYLGGVVEKAPGFFKRMWALESRLGAFFPCTWLNDHYLIILKRTCKEGT